MRVLGRTGVQVSELCLGAMVFGAWGNTDHDDCVRIISMALDGGINFVDTADVYAQGESEEIVGRALKGRRDDVIVATKGFGQMGSDPNERGNSRRWITRAVEASLRRLDTEWIDLYQIHRPDPTCDITETLSVLTDLVRAGKIRYIGSSTFPSEEIVEAQWASQRRGLERFVCEQPPYSVMARAIEADVLPTCLRHGIGVIVWSPLQGGWLTGKYRRGETVPPNSRASTNAEHFDYGDERKFDLVEELTKVASDAGLPLAQLALAFAVEHPAVTSAIIGVKSAEQLQALLPALGCRLDTDILDRIDAIVPPGLNVSARDSGWEPPALEPGARRRAR